MLRHYSFVFLTAFPVRSPRHFYMFSGMLGMSYLIYEIVVHPDGPSTPLINLRTGLNYDIPPAQPWMSQKFLLGGGQRNTMKGVVGGGFR